jgi:hypothetical protein
MTMPQVKKKKPRVCQILQRHFRPQFSRFQRLKSIIISAVFASAFLTTGCDFAKPRNFHCFFGRISIEKFKNAFQTERQFGKGPIQVL